MIALQIESVKQFMNTLLATEAFDIFLLEEATISTAATYSIDGRINQAFFSTEEGSEDVHAYEFLTFNEAKTLLFDLIKGKKTPLNFKFVLHLMPERVNTVLSRGETTITDKEIKAMVLTIKYDGEHIILLTGTAFHTFLMNKEPDLLWDQTLRHYLSSKGIGYEEM